MGAKAADASFPVIHSGLAGVAAPGASSLTLITPSVGAVEGNRTVVPVAGLGAAATALLTVTELPVILMAA